MVTFDGPTKIPYSLLLFCTFFFLFFFRQPSSRGSNVLLVGVGNGGGQKPYFFAFYSFFPFFTLFLHVFSLTLSFLVSFLCPLFLSSLFPSPPLPCFY